MKKTKTINSILKQQDFSKNEKDLIKRAYYFAQEAHKGQSIDSKGKVQFFNHPAYAGYFLARWGQSANAIASGFLHDVVEDCDIKLDEIERKFGNKVAFYVDGVSWFRRKINGKMIKDYGGYYSKFAKYVKKDPVLAIIKASDEMSKLPPKRSSKFIRSLKKRGIWESFRASR